MSHHSPPFPIASNGVSVPTPNFAEQDLHALVEKIGENILHHCDRPEIELHILNFLTHALGASTEGVANGKGITPDAAAVHLGKLESANRVWGQPAHGLEKAWHISQEGRRFLEEERPKLTAE